MLAEVVTGRHGDLWTQGLVIAYGRAAEAFSHEFGEGGLWLPVNGKLPEQLPEWAGDHGIKDGGLCFGFLQPLQGDGNEN